MKVLGKYFILISFLIFFIFNQAVFASGTKNISSQAARYVDLSCLDSEYKIHNVSESGDAKQITFINTKTGQRMSITFSKYIRALNNEEMSDVIENLRKNNGTGSKGKISSEITSCKSFNAHNQSISYFNVNQYENKKLWTKATIGVIGNYKGKSIIIQSYGPPETFNEQEMITFFSKLKLKPEAF